jgi:hypothetical protein
MEIEIVKLGSSKLNDRTKSPQWQAINETGSDPGDAENFGEVDVFQGLGLTSMPWPDDGESYAEGALVRNCGNRNGICIGARDTRTAAALGNVKPGDSILHSTGPNNAAQVQCKEDKRQVVLFTKDSSGKGVVIIVDGKNDQIQLQGFGQIIEMSKEHGIKIDNGKGASLLFQGSDLFINGNVHHKGIPPGMALQVGLPTGSPGGPASLPTIGAKGIGG